MHWDTEYYDFPHALFLHFFRTGDMKSFDTAVEAAAHLADVDISHYAVRARCAVARRRPHRPGTEPLGALLERRFHVLVELGFYKNESLFDR